jgi:peptide/nickel transport system substrate-binding protein
MKRGFVAFVVALLMVILTIPSDTQAANPTASATKKTETPSTMAEPSTSGKTGATATMNRLPEPQTGGILKVIIKSRSNAFGYPPRMAGADRDFAPPFFDRLLTLGDDGKYKPALALSWDTSKDGKTITFNLRQGVLFHDGTPFNAQAVKSNLDNLIPPKAKILAGITSVDVVDGYTVKLHLPVYNNLILHHFATNPATWMYSPDAFKKNGEDWAKTHPVGTGPFMLKDYQPNTSLTLVKNPHYWQKGLPYLDGIEMAQVSDAMTQVITLKAGQAHAIYDAQLSAAQLKYEGYPLQIAPGGLQGINFDTRNSEIFSKLLVRQAMEYAIDKEAICKGPGEGLYTPVYQILADTSPDYNRECPPRKYDPAKAKRLLAEAGYPNGFAFKISILDSAWKDGWVAVQSYLDQVGIKMEINYVNVSAFNLIRAGGKIEKGTAAYQTNPNSSNALYTLDTWWRSNSGFYPYIVKPAGIDKLIDQAKLLRDPGMITKVNRQILKLIYDDVTIVPIWQNSRIAVVNKSVQNTGWFIYGDDANNQFGTRTWLRK